MVCDSVNQCYDRSVYMHNVKMVKAPNFCPYCGNKWYVSAVSTLIIETTYQQPDTADPYYGHGDDCAARRGFSICNCGAGFRGG